MLPCTVYTLPHARYLCINGGWESSLAGYPRSGLTPTLMQSVDAGRCKEARREFVRKALMHARGLLP